ncbi:MAG: hypothetical protein V4484_08020 [Pseudomonadota bacterium]
MFRKNTWLASVLWLAAAMSAMPARACTVPGSSASKAVSSPLARRHIGLLAVASKARSDAALCAAMASADETQQALGLAFQRQRDKIFDMPVPDAAALQCLESSAVDAVTQLPGVGLAVGAETVYHYVSYAALASYAPSGSASERALRLAPCGRHLDCPCRAAHLLRAQYRRQRLSAPLVSRFRAA